MGSCAAPSAKGDDKFITTDYLQQCLTTGGMWEVNKNVYTTIGVAGVGNLNISDGGKFVSQNITFLGDKASGIGTLNLMDATSSFDTVGINVGNCGSGIVNGRWGNGHGFE